MNDLAKDTLISFAIAVPLTLAIFVVSIPLAMAVIAIMSWMGGGL